MRKHILKSGLKFLLVGARNYLFSPTSLRLRMEAGGPIRYELAAMIRVKNEGRFLPELLAYSQLIGVEHFYLYDNNSTDDLTEILAPFIQRGLVTLIPWKTVPASPSCYLDFWKNHVAAARWVAFIDADEFIVEKYPGFLLETLRKLPKKVPALALNWKYYGSSGHDRQPGGLIIDNLLRCDSEADQHIKVIARPDQVHSLFNPHNFFYRRGRLARAVSGQRIYGSHIADPIDTPLRINHYVYRSRENYLAKAGQGYADRQGEVQKSRRPERAESEFNKHNSTQDDLLSRTMGARTRELLIDMGYTAPYISGA